jgi:hypothetical protein
MTNDNTVEVIATAIRSLPDAVLVRLVLASLANTDFTLSQIAGTQADMEIGKQVGRQAASTYKHYKPRRRHKLH